MDFDKGTLLIEKQLQREKKPRGKYIFAPLKNDRSRRITMKADIRTPDRGNYFLEILIDGVDCQVVTYLVGKYEIRLLPELSSLQPLFKTVQGNLGHATAAFTLDVYGHVTDQMKQESAQRMENYMKKIFKNSC